jgi:DNA polymerase-4
LLTAASPIVTARGLTLLGVSLANVEDARAVQLALPLDGGRRRSVDVAVDAVRERFGAAAITRGVLIGRDPGIEMPLLPE